MPFSSFYSLLIVETHIPKSPNKSDKCNCKSFQLWQAVISMKEIYIYLDAPKTTRLWIEARDIQQRQIIK